MRIAIQNPQWICTTDSVGIHDYGVELLSLYRPIIYLSRPDYRARLKRFLQAKNLKIDDFEIVYTISGLNRRADALICLNGAPHIGPHRPVRRFNGMKIYHVMDYVIDAAAIRDALATGRVDFVMGYSSHDRFDPFFRRMFPTYVGRVINVPFGFHSRFTVSVPYAARRARCVAIGAVNPVHDPLLSESSLRDFTAFFRDEQWTHKFRRLLVENAERLADIMDSTLPVYPETKNTSFDMNAMLNAYKMFVSCESILNFPPAKAFEGPAAGAVMVCSDHECYRTLGFVHGANCIMHRPLNVDDFRDKVRFYISHPDLLHMIHVEGTNFVRDSYSHEAIARALYADIVSVYDGHPPGSRSREATGPCTSSPIAVGG